MIEYRWIGIAAALFVFGGVVGFGAGRLQQTPPIRQIAQQDILQGYALSLQAEDALHHGNSVAANTFSIESETYLLSAITPMEKLGMHNAAPILTAVQQAEYDIVHGKSSTHEQYVLRTFHRALSPYSHDGFGMIPQSRFQEAMNRVQTAINNT